MCNFTFLQSVRGVSGPGVRFFAPFQRAMELGSSGVGEAEARRPRNTRGLCPHSGRGHEHLEKELGRRLLPKLRWGGPRPRVVGGRASAAPS